MRVGRATFFGILGALVISLVMSMVRAAGVPISIEIVLGTLTGMAPGPSAFGLGFAIHLALGALFGLGYGWLFENVWDHGGASTGMLTAVVHASLIGLLLVFAPQLNPMIPSRLPDPGPYFSNLGPIAVVTFFVAHALYGAIVGAGYGHVAAEHQWEPTARP